METEGAARPPWWASLLGRAMLVLGIALIVAAPLLGALSFGQAEMSVLFAIAASGALLAAGGVWVRRRFHPSVHG